MALTTTLTTNIFNFNVTSLAGPVGYTMTQPYVLIRHLHIVNKTVTAASFSLWMGATGGNVAGTEVIGTGLLVAPNSAFDWFGILRMDVADFLVGGSGTATALTLEGEAEIGLV